MVTIAPHATASPENAVHCASQANREPARAARERLLIACLDEQMHVVRLNGEVHDTKMSVAVARECAPKLEEDELVP